MCDGTWSGSYRVRSVGSHSVKLIQRSENRWMPDVPTSVAHGATGVRVGVAREPAEQAAATSVIIPTPAVIGARCLECRFMSVAYRWTG